MALCRHHPCLSPQQCLVVAVTSASRWSHHPKGFCVCFGTWSFRTRATSTSLLSAVNQGCWANRFPFNCRPTTIQPFQLAFLKAIRSLLMGA